MAGVIRSGRARAEARRTQAKAYAYGTDGVTAGLTWKARGYAIADINR